MLSSWRARLRLPSFSCALASRTDRKSTRLNSSHSQISYAVFCLKKKTELHMLAPFRYIEDPHPDRITRHRLTGQTRPRHLQFNPPTVYLSADQSHHDAMVHVAV